MKRFWSSFLVMSLLLAFAFQKNVQAGTTGENLQGTITISGAWALYPMTVKWAEEFRKVHPLVKVDVAAGGAGKGMADALAQVVDIGMISRDINPAEIEKGAWWVSVTKDAVVPTINASNPLVNGLLTKGVKKESFIGIWITNKVKDWKDVATATGTTSGKTEIHVYTRSDACGAAEIWAKYMDKKQEDLLGIGVYGDPGLAEAVKKDALGIGYNNINYAYDAKTKKPIEGIKVLPIDLNNNGKIDENENFYNNSDEIVKAIAAGKYPSPPARNLHFASKGKPKKIVVEFIKWVLTDGQKYVPEAGYINLSEEQLKKELEKLK